MSRLVLPAALLGACLPAGRGAAPAREDRAAGRPATARPAADDSVSAGTRFAIP